MSEIVEFIGPRGVGKSTLYKNVIKLLSDNKRYIGLNDALPKIENAKFGSLDYFILKLRDALNRPLLNNKQIRKAGYEFLSQNPEFVNHCWNLSSKNQNKDQLGVDNRFRVANNIFDYFSKYQVAKNYFDNGYVITEELLLHTIVQLTDLNYKVDDIIKFSELVPLPYAVIAFDAPPDVIAIRSLKRKKIQSQKNLSTQELYNLSEAERNKIMLMLKILERRCVDVLNINTEHKIEDNVSKIIRYLSKLP